MTILLWWREIIITALVISCLWLINSNQKLDFKIKEVEIQHQSEILKAEKKTSDLVATVESQRKKDAENYAKEINTVNDKYNSAIANNVRMQSEIKAYSNRISTVSREAVENYAKTASAIYAECRSEYIEMGYYASKLDAELDKVTKSPQ